MKLMGRRTGPRDDEGRMPLRDHLRELRNRLIKSIAALLVGMVIGWALFDPIWEFMKEPFCRLPPELRWGNSDECTLIVSGIFQSFFLKLKISFIVGLILAAPVWLLQIWAFIAPGLHRNERRWTYIFLGAAIPLFFLGVTIAYFTIQLGMQLLLSFQFDGVEALISVDQYLGYVLTILLIFGVAMELPMLVVILNLAGVLTHQRIKKSQRTIIFCTILFAALVTPGDPFTTAGLSIPLILLFEVAALIAFLNDRRRGKRDPYAGLSDDEAAPLNLDEIDEELERGGRRRR